MRLKREWYAKRMEDPEYRALRREQARKGRLTPERQQWERDYYASEAGKRVSRRKAWKAYGVVDLDYAEEVYQAGKDGPCQLCDGPTTGSGGLHLDHDHKTGQVRGLLCSKCNHALGLLNDDPELLRRAVDWVS